MAKASTTNVYGRRRGKRIRSGRLRLLEEFLPKIQLPLGKSINPNCDPLTFFPTRINAVWLEIGFGSGEHLARQAISHPNVGFIGAEPYVSGVARLLRHIKDNDIDNIRILVDDVSPLLEKIQHSSISKAFLLFPDPWPKHRHHKRRFVNLKNLALMAKALCDGASWQIATDDKSYFYWICEHVNRHPDFNCLPNDFNYWQSRPSNWIGTRYEQKAIAKGLSPIYVTFQRNPRNPT